MMKKKLILSLLSLAVLPMMLASCNTGSGKKDPDTPIVVTTKYTVAFESLGVRYKTLKVEEGKTITEDVPDPVNEGYIFEGWFLENTKVDIKTYVVSKDVTFVAHWKEDTGDQLNVDDVKDAAKTYSLVMGWWEVNDESDPTKVTSGLTRTSVRQFYTNIINVLKAKGQTDAQIAAISFRNYSSATVAEMGAAVNADADVDLLIGVGANVFTTATCKPYNTTDDSKFKTSMGEKERYVALLENACDLGKDLYEWLQTDIGKQSFLKVLTAEEIAQSLVPETIDLTVTVHGDTDAVTRLTDKTTAITMPTITVPSGKQFKGFALTADGEVVLNKAIDAELKYDDLKDLVAANASTLDLYPIFEAVAAEDLIVYVQTGSNLSEAEAKLLEARFNASLTEDKKVKFNNINASADDFTNSLGTDADVVIGGNTPLKNYTAHADGALKNAGLKHFANASRKVLIKDTVNTAHLDLAKKFYNFVIADATNYVFHATFWTKDHTWVTTDEETAITAAVTARVNTYLGIADTETLLDKYNVTLTFYSATNTKVADLCTETKALQEGKGTDLIIGCGNNVNSDGYMTIVDKKTVDTSIIANNRYVALVRENPLARDVYENYFVVPSGNTNA